MKNIFLKGGLALWAFLLLALPALANLEIRPAVDSAYSFGEKSNWESDAYGYANIALTGTIGNKLTGIDAYIKYNSETGPFVFAAGLNPVYIESNQPAGLSQIDQNMTFTLDPVDNFRRAKLTKTVPAATPFFLSNLNDYTVYTCRFLVKPGQNGSTPLYFDSDFARALAKNDQGETINVTGNVLHTINSPKTITITPAAPPSDFTGPLSAINKGNGNTITITWTDLNANNNGFINDNTPPIKYDIYLDNESFNNPLNENYRLEANLSGSSKELGGNGVPLPINTSGSHPHKAQIEKGLSDGTTYYIRMRAKDSTTNPDALGTHKTTNTDNAIIASVTPTDHIAPNVPANFASAAGDTQINLSWTSPGGDTGGFVLIRYLATPVGNPVLVGAAAKDPNNLGTIDGNEYPVGTELNGGKVIYNGPNSSFPDTGTDLPGAKLQNGVTYYYKVAAYDIAGIIDGKPRQQGRNYSGFSDTSAIPGVKPSGISNFYATSGTIVNEVKLNWTNVAPQGGTLIWSTTDQAKWSLIPEPDGAGSAATWKDVAAMEGIKLFDVKKSSDQNPNETARTTLLADPAVQLNPQATYFFKAFTYNSGTEWTGIDSLNAFIDAHKFSAGAMAATKPLSSGPQTSKITLNAGLNFFALGINPDQNGNWYVGPLAIKTVGNLITNVLGGLDNVSTFGYINSLGNIEGVKVVNGAWDNAAFLAQPLKAVQGYQVYLKAGVPEFTLSNQSPVL